MDTSAEAVDDPGPSGTENGDELTPLVHRVIALAKTKPKGISDKDISMELPNLKPEQKVQIINKLLMQGYIDLFQQGKTLLYRLKDPSTKAKGADNEEKIVYSLIERAGNKGIWMRDIRFGSSLGQPQLTKILKSLETKKFIKLVKSVSASKKKVYMLYNLEPDRSVTGGAWYQDQDFEAEFVDVLNQQCFRFLDHKREENKSCKGGPIAARNVTFASSQEVWKFISDLGISKVTLSVEDLEMILNTLVYDGKVEKILSPDGNNLYRAIQPLLSPPGLIKTPCGVCPVSGARKEQEAGMYVVKMFDLTGEDDQDPRPGAESIETLFYQSFFNFLRINDNYRRYKIHC